MSLPRICVSCFSGKHEGHQKDLTRPGVIGGTYCPCQGECEKPKEPTKPKGYGLE